MCEHIREAYGEEVVSPTEDGYYEVYRCQKCKEFIKAFFESNESRINKMPTYQDMMRNDRSQRQFLGASGIFPYVYAASNAPQWDNTDTAQINSIELDLDSAQNRLLINAIRSQLRTRMGLDASRGIIEYIPNSTIEYGVDRAIKEKESKYKQFIKKWFAKIPFLRLIKF